MNIPFRPTQDQINDFGWTFLDEVVEWIQENLNPEDIFTNDQLMDWAEDNGLVEE